MTKQEARVWINKHAEATRDIYRNIDRWKDASGKALSDPRADRLASYFESKAIEIYMDNGGDDDFAAVHMIGSLAEEMQHVANG